MKLLVLLAAVYSVHCGIINQEHGVEHHERATSYQNFHIEHFHPVPTYIKKEDNHLLEHPISIGKTSSKVEIHHGGKHDHGYALTDNENNLHGHGFEDFNEGLGGAAGHGLGSYQVQDQGEDYAQYQGQFGHLGQGSGNLQYQLGSGQVEYSGNGGDGRIPSYDNHEA